jgi:hypothetical protein
MDLSLTIVAGIIIYGVSGCAAWWVNSKVQLGPTLPQATRIILRSFLLLIVFIAVSFPLTFALEPVFG